MMIEHCLPAYDVLAAEFGDQVAMDLGPDQVEAFEHISALRHGLVLLTGGPGTGKSFLTRKLLLHFTQQGRRALISAATGAAAVRLSLHACTVHRNFCLPVGSRPMRGLNATHPVRAVLKEAQVIFIDEMSMMSKDNFDSVILRLQQVHNLASPDEVFEKLLIVLVGDDAQVGPRRAGFHSLGWAASTCFLLLVTLSTTP